MTDEQRARATKAPRAIFERHIAWVARHGDGPVTIDLAPGSPDQIVTLSEPTEFVAFRFLLCPYCRIPSSASAWSLSFACPCGSVAEWDVVVGAGVAVPWVAWWTPGSPPEWWWER